MTTASTGRPRLSMIVPARDQEPYLADCLTSLTRQLTTDPSALEVIVVDDGSTDETAAVAARFAGRLPGLRVIGNREPVGLASARNQGLDAAGAVHVGFLDADDWLAPGHLDHLLTMITSLGVDFVRTDHVQTTLGQRTQHRAPESRRHRVLDPRESVLPHRSSTMVDYCYAWAGLFDTRLGDLLRFPAGLHTAEDRPWAWRLHLQARSFAVVGSPGILYRRGNHASLTQILDRRQLDFLPSFELVFALVRADGESERFWPKAARMFLAVLHHHLGRAELMAPADAATLLDRGRALVAEIPDEVVAQTLSEASVERREALLPLVPARVGRRFGPVAA